MKNLYISIALIIATSVISLCAPGFTGQQSSSSGDLFLRYRYYDPEAGVFLSKDPIGVAGGLNAYQYCASNPTNLTDPMGLTYKTNLIFLKDFLTGEGEEGNNRVYGFDAVQTQEMASSPGVNKMRDLFYAKSGSDVQDYGYGTLNAAIGTLLNPKTADWGSTAAQVGAWNNGKVTNLGNGYAAFSVSNSATVNSLLYHIGDAVQTLTFGLVPATAINRTTGPLGSIKQTFEWTEPIDSSRLGNSSDTFKPLKFKNSNRMQSGVLIDKAAELVGSNLADIKGATYDPASNQIIFLGSNSTPGVEGIDMDYFYTAVQAVYGSAIPPYVSLDAPASAASLWQDLGDGDGNFEAQEWGGFTLRYNPLWAEVDSNVAVRVKCKIGATNYDFNVNFTPQTIDWLQYPNGQYPMHLVYPSITGTAPPGISVWDGPFTSLPYPQTVLDYVNASSNTSGGQDWTYPFQLYNGGTGTITNISFAVIPDRQHRRFGGRLEGTKLGWVLQEADRIMKCLAIGTDNVTGANYTSATVPIAGFKNLAEINAAGTSVLARLSYYGSSESLFPLPFLVKIV